MTVDVDLAKPFARLVRERSKVVFASTIIGALAGGMFAGLLSNGDGESRTDNGDVITGAMTAGLWGGFGLGIMIDEGIQSGSAVQPTGLERKRAPEYQAAGDGNAVDR